MNSAAAVFLSSIFLFSRTLVVPVSPAALQVHAVGVTQPMSVPQGAQHAVMLTVELHATCAGGVSVSSVTVHHSGLGASQDLLRAYAVDASTMMRLTNSVPLSGNPPAATLRFTQPLSIAPCGSKTVVIEADVSPTAAAGGEHVLTLNATTDVSSTAQTVSVTADGLTILSTTPATPAQLSVTFLPVQSSDVLYGSDRTVARFQLSSSSDRPQTVQSVMLTNDGTASDADLQNLFLTTSGGKVLTGALPSLTAHTATFVFDPPLTIDAHATQLLQVHADVRASKRYTIQLILEEPNDLSATASNR